jgi:uncharacterized membrane protein YdjX (TVP38/TMEM64 family)
MYYLITYKNFLVILSLTKLPTIICLYLLEASMTILKEFVLYLTFLLVILLHVSFFWQGKEVEETP